MGERHIEMPAGASFGRLDTSGPAIRVEGVAKSFGPHRVLTDVSFELERGRVYSIMGPSGCGKSTLLKIMIGAERPDRGRVFIDGMDMWAASRRELDRVRRKFGVLFQSGALLNGLTCGENVALPLRQHTDLPDSTIQMMVRMKLEMVGMGHAVDKRPPELSGGMKKRCALARAIALDPAIVFFDEPSAGIDPVMISVLDHLVLDLTERLGITAVVITHEMPSAFRISDEMLMLWNGKIHFRGTPEDFRASTDAAVAQFIHGGDDGPLSRGASRQAVAGRVLGFSNDELEAATARATRGGTGAAPTGADGDDGSSDSRAERFATVEERTLVESRRETQIRRKSTRALRVESPTGPDSDGADGAGARGAGGEDAGGR